MKKNTFNQASFFGWSLLAVMCACVLIVALPSCFTEIQDLSCDTAADCFNGEICPESTKLCTLVRESETGTSVSTTTTNPQGNRFVVEGIVTLSGSGEPIQGILVDAGLSGSAVTGDDGSFRISIDAPFGAIVSVTAAKGDPRYREEEKEIVAPDGGTIETTFILVPENCETGEEICDDEDNDCDGRIDEGIPLQCGVCRLDVQLGGPCGPCSEGTWICADQQGGVECVDGNNVLVPNADKIEGDVCDRSANQRCGQIMCAGSVQECSATDSEAGLSCTNNHDDDCDGLVDQDDPDCTQ